MPRVSAGRRAGYRQKPPLGATLQGGHPLANRLIGAWLFNEYGGTTNQDLTGLTGNATFSASNVSWSIGQGGGGAATVDNTAGDSATGTPRTTPSGANVSFFQFSQATTVALSRAFGGNLNSSGSGYYFKTTTGGTIFQRFLVQNSVGTNGTASDTTALDTALHAWLGTWDGTTVRLYRDGVQVGTGALSGTAINFATNPVYPIGVGSGASSTSAGAIVYAAYLWNRTLSPDEAKSLTADPYGMFGPPATRLWLVSPPGGSTFNQALTGSMAGTGGITRQTGKQAAGTVSPAGAITRQASKALGASITEGGALIRSSTKVLSGATTPAGGLHLQTGKGLTSLLTQTGNIIRQAGKSLAGSSTLAGSVHLQTGKVLAAAMASVGSMARVPGKVLTAALTPAGTLASAAMHVLMVALTATLTPAGGMVRQTNRVLSGVLTPAGALGRTTARMLSASLTGVGSLLAGVPHLFLVALAASITPAASLHRRIGRVLGAALGVFGFLAGTPVRRTLVRVHPRTVGETPPLLRVQAAGPTTRTVQQAPSWRLRMVAEPAEPLPPVALPEGTRVVPLGSAVRVLQAGAPQHTVPRPTPIVRIVCRK